MDSLLKTSDKPKNERFEFWRHLVSDTFTPLDVACMDPQNFSASIRFQKYAGVEVARIMGDAQTVTRGEAEISQSNTDEYYLIAHVSGRNVIAQDGREVYLQPGDSTIVSTTRPYSISFDEPLDQIAVTIPRAIWLERSPHGEPATASRIPGGGAVIGRYVDYIRDLGAQNPIFADEMANNLLDMCVLIARRTEAALAESDEFGLADRRLKRVRAYVMEHLYDENLCPAEAARAVGVSLRTLHKVFQGAGMTFTRYVTEQRLQAVRRRLEDPGRRSMTVAQIAFETGFSNLSSFGRAFKGRFGVAPRDYRFSKFDQHALGANH
ncbi:MAG: helix-turn-helix domain-containing protein [Pseudomonadota bacterium]